ncbi:long-chain-fatty-acid--CoA ligase [Hirschia baltica]|uniref:AMP-dependent synthetase and ligase n=1 Tax=Hirschia baltica (strain ATCC 49814 / DSM 5838 / IFAM 1418) TaxID=582402 RepID=C6XNX2_HIRBI|nr:long-chain-fatty-acid--CoA ligase [Hirschia baltica]ACT60152.1 AMP-dependent synthetase and ligase [Hirschia baltica ATCC 49814]
MIGLMQNQPLLISTILEHAHRWHGTQRVVGYTTEGDLSEVIFAQIAKRAASLANSVLSHGMKLGSSAGIIAMNNHRHLELWYGLSGVGAIAHSINPRLTPEQVAYVINDAGDEMLFIDTPFIPLVAAILQHTPKVKRVVILTDDSKMTESIPFPAVSYESYIAGHSDTIEWPMFDEQSANAICHTSGTTGRPKGVRYSHRSNVLHALAVSAKDVLGVGALDCVLPMVPMFHANGWGMPYGCLAHGAALVFPGFKMDGPSLLDLVLEQGVTVALGVPTICSVLLEEASKRGSGLGKLEKVAIAGSAAPPKMIEEFAGYGVEVIHAWGMTETSPIGTANADTPQTAFLPKEDKAKIRALQGRPVFGVDLKIVDESGHELPRDGVSVGRLFVRGAWVIQRYHGQDSDCVDAEGWFDTGDIASISEEGFLFLTDRAKDLIKSGGEWISSVELENIASSHPQIAAVAAIGIAHPQWDERPLLIVVPSQPETPLRKGDVINFIASKVARISVPDDVIFVKELPLGATGKVQKTKLRSQYKGYFGVH